MVCGTYAEDLRRALESDWSDIEDYLIAHASKHIPAKYLITRDKELIERSPVKAMPAQKFLDLLERDYGSVSYTHLIAIVGTATKKRHSHAEELLKLLKEYDSSITS